MNCKEDVDFLKLRWVFTTIHPLSSIIPLVSGQISPTKITQLQVFVHFIQLPSWAVPAPPPCRVHVARQPRRAYEGIKLSLLRLLPWNKHLELRASTISLWREFFWRLLWILLRIWANHSPWYLAAARALMSGFGAQAAKAPLLDSNLYPRPGDIQRFFEWNYGIQTYPTRLEHVGAIARIMIGHNSWTYLNFSNNWIWSGPNWIRKPGPKWMFLTFRLVCPEPSDYAIGTKVWDVLTKICCLQTRPTCSCKS